MLIDDQETTLAPTQHFGTAALLVIGVWLVIAALAAIALDWL